MRRDGGQDDHLLVTPSEKKNLHLVEKKGENKMRIKMQSASHEIEWTAGSWSWSLGRGTRWLKKYILRNVG